VFVDVLCLFLLLLLCVFVCYTCFISYFHNIAYVICYCVFVYIMYSLVWVCLFRLCLCVFYYLCIFFVASFLVLGFCLFPEAPHFSYTTMQLNLDYVAELHVDPNNEAFLLLYIIIRRCVKTQTSNKPQHQTTNEKTTNNKNR